MARKTGQTFRILLRALADVSEGKGDALFITTSTRAATVVWDQARTILAVMGIAGCHTKVPRQIVLPNGKLIKFRGPTGDQDRQDERGRVFNRYHDGAA